MDTLHSNNYSANGQDDEGETMVISSRSRPKSISSSNRKSQSEETRFSNHSSFGINDNGLVASTEEDCCELQHDETSPNGVCKEADTDSSQPLIYGILDKPPIHLLILFAIQQCLVAIHAPLSCTALVADVVCAGDDDYIKTHILSATNMMVGIATILMTTVGVRLPIFQGPSPVYLINFVAMTNVREWQCPPVAYQFDPSTNATAPYAMMGNGSLVPQREIIMQRIGALSGSLAAAGGIHFLIGLTGLVGVIARFIGPITIVPPLMLVGLNFYAIAVKFSENNWIDAIVTVAVCLLLSMYLRHRRTPIPFWTKSKGFHIIWYPLHQVFAILIGLLIGWMVSAIQTGVSGEPVGGRAEGNITRSVSQVVDSIDWFIFPYPGKFGSYSINLNAFINFVMITFLSVLDSIGDYNLSARTSRVPLPPRYALNRGLTVEGLMCTVSGFMGCCHATMSYGSNVAVMGITRVVSIRVFQVLGIIYILFSVVGKVGAVFVTIPYSVIGGIQIVSFGVYIGIVISYLQTIDLNSNRNVTILGISLLLGFMLPHWVQKTGHGVQTGIADLDDIINILLSNSAFVGAIIAFFFDTTIPGTRKERGLLCPDHIPRAEDDCLSMNGSLESRVYRLPFLKDSFRRSKITKFIPLFDRQTTITSNGKVVDEKPCSLLAGTSVE